MGRNLRQVSLLLAFSFTLTSSIVHPAFALKTQEPRENAGLEELDARLKHAEGRTPLRIDPAVALATGPSAGLGAGMEEGEVPPPLAAESVGTYLRRLAEHFLERARLGHEPEPVGAVELRLGGEVKDEHTFSVGVVPGATFPFEQELRREGIWEKPADRWVQPGRTSFAQQVRTGAPTRNIRYVQLSIAKPPAPREYAVDARQATYFPEEISPPALFLVPRSPTHELEVPADVEGFLLMNYLGPRGRLIWDHRANYLISVGLSDNEFGLLTPSEFNLRLKGRDPSQVEISPKARWNQPTPSGWLEIPEIGLEVHWNRSGRQMRFFFKTDPIRPRTYFLYPLRSAPVAPAASPAKPAAGLEEGERILTRIEQSDAKALDELGGWLLEEDGRVDPLVLEASRLARALVASLSRPERPVRESALLVLTRFFFPIRHSQFHPALVDSNVAAAAVANLADANDPVIRMFAHRLLDLMLSHEQGIFEQRIASEVSTLARFATNAQMNLDTQNRSAKLLQALAGLRRPPFDLALAQLPAELLDARTPRSRGLPPRQLLGEASQEGTPPSAAGLEEGSRPEDVRFLVVDDAGLMQEHVRDYLGSFIHSVAGGQLAKIKLEDQILYASSVEETQQRLRELPEAVVLVAVLDLRLSSKGKTGLALASQIRKKHPGALILMLSSADPEKGRDAKRIERALSNKTLDRYLRKSDMAGSFGQMRELISEYLGRVLGDSGIDQDGSSPALGAGLEEGLSWTEVLELIRAHSDWNYPVYERRFDGKDYFLTTLGIGAERESSVWDFQMLLNARWTGGRQGGFTTSRFLFLERSGWADIILLPEPLPSGENYTLSSEAAHFYPDRGEIPPEVAAQPGDVFLFRIAQRRVKPSDPADQLYLVRVLQDGRLAVLEGVGRTDREPDFYEWTPDGRNVISGVRPWQGASQAAARVSLSTLYGPISVSWNEGKLLVDYPASGEFNFSVNKLQPLPPAGAPAAPAAGPSTALGAGGSTPLTTGLEEQALDAGQVYLLIVEDEPLSRDHYAWVVREEVKAYGPAAAGMDPDRQLLIAENYAQAAEMIRQYRPHWVAADRTLGPGPSGFDLAVLAKEENPSAYVLMLSSTSPDDPQVRTAIATGTLDAFVQKSTSGEDDVALRESLRAQILSRLALAEAPPLAPARRLAQPSPQGPTLSAEAGLEEGLKGLLGQLNQVVQRKEWGRLREVFESETVGSMYAAFTLLAAQGPDRWKWKDLVPLARYLIEFLNLEKRLADDLIRMAAEPKLTKAAPPSDEAITSALGLALMPLILGVPPELREAALSDDPAPSPLRKFSQGNLAAVGAYLLGVVAGQASFKEIGPPVEAGVAQHLAALSRDLARETRKIMPDRPLWLADLFAIQLDEAGPSTGLGAGLEEAAGLAPDDPRVRTIVNLMMLMFIKEGVDRLNLRFETEGPEASYLVGDLFSGPPSEEVLRKDLGQVRVPASRQVYNSLILRLKIMADLGQQIPRPEENLRGRFELEVAGKPVELNLTVTTPLHGPELATLRLNFPEGRPTSGPQEEWTAGLEEAGAPRALLQAPTATQTKLGYVVDAGIGLLVRGRPEARNLLIVAEGLEQAEALIEAGVSSLDVLAIVADEEEKQAAERLLIPKTAIFRLDEFANVHEARRRVWNVAGGLLKVLNGVDEVTFLRATARTLPGLLAQLKEILPLPWQEAGVIDEEDLVQVLRLYELGV